MKITNENPVVIEPVEAKTYPDLWIYGINILAPTTTSGRLQIDLLPYNSDKQDIYPGNHETITTDELWSAVVEVPEVAQAMFAIFQAVPALRSWIKKKEEMDLEQPVVEESVN